MDIIYEIEGRFRITYIPFVGEGRLREPFLINFRTDGDDKAESLQLPRDLFHVIVGCPTPDIFHKMRPYLASTYSMSDGLLTELLNAPRELADFAFADNSSVLTPSAAPTWRYGAPRDTGCYLWRDCPDSEVHDVQVRDDKVGGIVDRTYVCYSLTGMEFDDFNRGQWLLRESS